MRLASLSIDLDPLRCYYQIHGLPGAEGLPPTLAEVIVRRALPRFLEVCERCGVRSTLFVVGSDVGKDASAETRALFTQAASVGHELGNHSYSHPYDLARWPRHAIEREVGDCHEALRALTGRPPRGFRAPGYELSANLLDVLDAFGYAYDSSVWPCPPYYAAKLLVLAKMALFRQHSASIVGAPQALLAPTQPYRPRLERPWQRGQAGVVELPIAVTRTARLPAIGTFLLMNDSLRWLLFRGVSGMPFVNLELHGVDLIDADEDGIPAELVNKQPELRVPVRDKIRRLEKILIELRNGALVLPLCQVAEELQRSGAV